MTRIRFVCLASVLTALLSVGCSKKDGGPGESSRPSENMGGASVGTGGTNPPEGTIGIERGTAATGSGSTGTGQTVGSEIGKTELGTASASTTGTTGTAPVVGPGPGAASGGDGGLGDAGAAPAHP